MICSVLKVSIVVPAYNEQEHLDLFLDSLISQSIFKSDRYQTDVIFIDGGSKDNTVSDIKVFFNSYPEFDSNILFNPLKIVPISMNLGIRKSNADIILRLDVHSVYPEEYALELVNFLVKSKKNGVVNVGAPMETAPGDDTSISKAIAMVTSSSFGVGSSFRNFKNINKPVNIDTVPFGCWWKKDLIKIGLFDEEMVRNQDDELNWRFRKSGGKVVIIPIKPVKYFARTNFKHHWLTFFQYGFFKPLTFIKSGNIGSYRSFAPLLLFLCSLSSTIFLFFDSTILKIGIIYFLILIPSYLIITLIIMRENLQKYDLMLMLLSFYALFNTHLSYGLGFFMGTLNYFLPLFTKINHRDSR